MALIEGGAFKCGSHDVETSNVAEWNKHCLAYPDVHYEIGETGCMNCGQKIYFDKLPYHPIDEKTGSKNISLRCEDCESRIVGNAKLTSVKQVGAKK